MAELERSFTSASSSSQKHETVSNIDYGDDQNNILCAFQYKDISVWGSWGEVSLSGMGNRNPDLAVKETAIVH